MCFVECFDEEMLTEILSLEVSTTLEHRSIKSVEDLECLLVVKCNFMFMERKVGQTQRGLTF